MGSPAGMYGAERWILALIKHLSVDTVESIVGVIQDGSGNGETDLCRYAAEAGFETVEFQSPGRLSRSAIKKIRQFIRANEIDIIHTHGHMNL